MAKGDEDENFNNIQDEYELQTSHGDPDGEYMQIPLYLNKKKLSGF